MSWPAGLLAFRKCPVPGCLIDVYGPRGGDPAYCIAHGGDPSLPQFCEPDEWGEPIPAGEHGRFPPPSVPHLLPED